MVFYFVDYVIMLIVIFEYCMGCVFGVYLFSGYVGFVLVLIFMIGIVVIWYWKVVFLMVGVFGLFGVLLLWINGDLIFDWVCSCFEMLNKEVQLAGEFVVGGLWFIFSVLILMCFFYFVCY